MKQYIVLRDLEKTLLGRSVYTEEGALSLCWTLSGFFVRFEATRAVLHFAPGYREETPAYVQVTVDGNKSKHAISTGKEKIVLEDLGEGAHMLKLVKLTEGDEGLNIAALEIFGEDCKVLEAPKLPELRMEFIGDSITCGYGALSDSTVTEYYSHEQDASLTYANLTAEALCAEIRTVAISGQGIVKNYAGEIGLRIPTFFEYEMRIGCKQHDFATWVPQVVVVNAGTNDDSGRVTDDEFYAGANAFLDRIREVYPEAYVIWAYGMMGLRYNDVLTKVFDKRRVTDKKMKYVPIRPIFDFPEEIGVGAHPTAIGHARAAKVLTAAIKEEMGL